MRNYSDSRLYTEWVQDQDTLSDADRQAVRDSVLRLPLLPLFSLVLLPAPDGAASAAHATVASMLRQIYPHWELWLPQDADSADTNADKRLRVIQSGGTTIVDHAGLFNAALAAAEGEFVLPLLPDAILAEHALYELTLAIGNDPEVSLVYTDEDRLDAAGNRCMPHFKTGWDPDLALGRDAIGLLVAYRKALLEQLGGMRSSLLGVALALYELSLQVAFTASPVHIKHVPAMLCHRRGVSEASLGWDAQGAREIVRKHLAESRVSASVVAAPLAPAWNRIVRDLPDPAPLVSVIVPTRDKSELLEGCVDAVLSRTNYSAVELLVVDNDSREAKTADLFHSLSGDTRVRILQHPGPFNYAAMNNWAAREARGEILLLLNNDVDAIQPDWLREMVSQVVRRDVGAVGAKLLYVDGRGQHAGVVLGPNRSVNHQFRFSDRLDAGPSGELALTRTVSAVTGACLAVRRSVFFEVGGLDENLRIAFNDIDFCMRLGDHGYRIVWTPFAELVHHEGGTRGYDTTPEKQAVANSEHRYLCRFWGSLLETDPFRNPNLIYGWDTIALSPVRHQHWPQANGNQRDLL
jgi:GT2 family glycosyltransferase